VEKERDGSYERVDRGETVGNRLGGARMERTDTGVRTRWTEKGTVGNSSGRAPVGRSDTGMSRKKRCEIAWGELR